VNRERFQQIETIFQAVPRRNLEPISRRQKFSAANLSQAGKQIETALLTCKIRQE
jgi:hypothetical protein